MSVYLAASFGRREALRDLARRLEAEAPGVVVTSRWLAATEDVTAPAECAVAAQQCCQDIARSSVVVVFAEPANSGYFTGGRHVELGVALAMGKAVFLMGQPENVFGWLPSVYRLDSVEQLLEALRLMSWGWALASVHTEASV